MKVHIKITTSLMVCFSLLSCGGNKIVAETCNIKRAVETLDAIYTHYGIENSHLLRETFPYNITHKATYLAEEEKDDQPNLYSYLWPYSGSLSAVTALYENNNQSKFLKILEHQVLPGLEMYFDVSRSPFAYSSYVNIAPKSDRFYDDNIWLGIDFTDLYLLTKNKDFLEKAELIWQFVESGTDSILGGGIYWCEQKKNSKNACSNAPGSVYALKLYNATKDNRYLQQGEALYHWTKNNLQDQNDFLYYDNINLEGAIGKRKYPYNSGQMLQASVLLYRITNDKQYLIDAQNIAKSCYNHFFMDRSHTDGKLSFRLLKNEDIWFTAVMLRGFIELYNIDNNREYLNAFQHNLDYAWKYMRAENGLFNSDWSGYKKDDSKWLLPQFAMVEMYARISKLK